MISEERRLRFASIDIADQTYRITTLKAIEILCRSIQAVGLINPPILFAKADKYAIVSGFRRIQACQALMWNDLPVRILDSRTPALECAKLAVADNTSRRELNPVEQSRAFHLLALHLDEAHLMQIALGLGLAGQPAVVGKIRTIKRLPQEIQTFIIAGSIPFPIALELNKIPAAHAIRLATMFHDLKLNLNRQREFLTLLNEIAARESIPLEAILDAPSIRATLSRADLDGPRKTHIIRSYLKQRRFPHLTRAETEFTNLVKQLRLGRHMKMTAPADFEGSAYCLQLVFESLDELAQHQKKLDTMVSNSNLKKILARGGDD